MEFTQYRRTQIAEMTPWRGAYNMDDVSISKPDREAGSPKPGDMIARNPKNHADMWLVAAQYFADNFEPVTSQIAWDSNANRYYEPVEKLAAEIYETFVYDGPGKKPAWCPHGNGLKLDEARAEARRRLRESGHAPAVSAHA